MYSGNYGFPNAAGPTFNGAPPPSQNLHGQGPTPNQHMMYNQPQFPMASHGAGFPGGPNMMPGAGPAAAMMQNTGMPHMAAANGQMPNYQTPYSNSPYGPSVPSSVAPQMNIPPNYAIPGGMAMSGFPIHPGQMTPQQQQQMMQRMQPPNTGGMPASTTQRPFPGQGQGQGQSQGLSPQGTSTPNNALQSQKSQYPAPQNPQGTPQSQTPNNAHQQSQQQPPQHQSQQQSTLVNIQTPQTPTFPHNVQGSTANGTSSSSTPLSPGGEAKEKERVAVVLEINNELLLEAMQIQHTQKALKEEHEAAPTDTENKSTEDDLLKEDYVNCMRRLQSNLSWLAALADKKASGTAPRPAYLKAPPLNTKVKLRQMQAPDGAENRPEPADREETAKYIGELYTKLQGLYPGIDANKEPSFQPSNQRPGAQGQKTPGQPSPISSNTRTPKMATVGSPTGGQPTAFNPGAI